jgi:Toastrack DUF4097
VSVSGFSGPASLHTTSGSIVASDLGGLVRLTTASGGIRGTNVDRVREARSMSGAVDLAGAFVADARVVTTSGAIRLQFEPGASVRIDASTMSGGISANGPGMQRPEIDARSRTLTLGSGAAQLQVRTTGHLRLRRGGSLEDVRAVRPGRNGMPAYNEAQISDTELRDLQAYLATIGSTTRRGDTERCLRGRDNSRPAYPRLLFAATHRLTFVLRENARRCVDRRSTQLVSRV